MCGQILVHTLENPICSVDITGHHGSEYRFHVFYPHVFPFKCDQGMMPLGGSTKVSLFRNYQESRVSHGYQVTQSTSLWISTISYHQFFFRPE